MPGITTLFVDKGGVLVDNTVLGAQYQRLIAEYLSQVLGGETRGWRDANVWAFDRQYERWQEAAKTPPQPNIREWFAHDARSWLYDMCEMVDLPRPPADEAYRIATDTLRYCMDRVGIQVPRIAERLSALRLRGLTLHTASGDAEEDLVAYLKAIGVRELFDRVYGADVVNVWKSSAGFYRAILADAGVHAREAIVIDDSERAIGWAAECGLRGVLVRRAPGEPFEAAVTRALDEVERLLG
jgi:FMN phosphatase YigB (HAD superfamily)